MITVKGTVPVQLDSGQVMRITYNELKDCRDYFLMEMNHEEPSIFVLDDVEADKAEIQRHIDAITLIMEWYA